MASKQPRVPRTSTPRRKTDDFSLIRGIGPAITSRLYDAGIRSYNQLTSLSPTELAARVTGLSARQIARQDWIGQARKLAPKMARLKSHRTETAMPMIRQHYENFTIECLLDEKNEMRRTRVVHIQSGDADTWPGWETKQLIDFLARHAQVRIPAIKMGDQEKSAARREASQNVNDQPSSLVVSTPGPAQSFSPMTRLAQPGTEIVNPFLQSPAIDLTGTLRLRDLKVVLVDSDTPIFFLRQGQLYLLQLTVDLADVVTRGDTTFIYKTTINFNQLGGDCYTVNETSSVINQLDSTTFSILGPGLPEGLYRLDAIVRLVSNEAEPGLMAFLEGDLLQVY